jgi:sarcosine oxidase subunit gamma
MSQQVSTPIEGVTTAAAGARFGVKGADAAALLLQRGLRIPMQPNRVIHWHGGDVLGSGRCLRQGSSEFLIELDTAPQTPLAGDDAIPRAWTLIRADHSLLLQGAQWPAALAHCCSFDFERLQAEPDLVVMTLLAGISVTVIREPSATGIALRLWCDPGFGLYLQQCLQTLSQHAAPATRG